MIAMLKKVFQILYGADKTLCQSLKVSLITESSSHGSEEEVTAIQLVPLLHPYVQRLFVGTNLHVCLIYSICLVQCVFIVFASIFCILLC